MMRSIQACCAAAIVFALVTSARSADLAPQSKWLAATPEKLPRWRGFNLLEKFQVSGRKPFVEDDFRLIAKLGFNFVRLPMDYRCWIVGGDWEKLDEVQLKEVDQAVAWGEKYGIHVMVNFHRAPGYTVASPAEKTSLWTDAKTQEVCAMHWGTFARRYKGIPSERVSFNLMNEPAGVEAKAYVAVVRKLAEAIRREDPQRLIISDGLQWGQNPILELAELRIAQATRGYTPMEISHYKASWVNSQNFPEPQWPRLLAPNGTLLGPKKPEGSHPLVIDGPFAKETELRLHVLQVSSAAHLVVEADGKSIFEKKFQSGPGEGEWKKVVYSEKYKIYQNIFDRDYTATIPAGTKQVQVRVADGDWLQLGEIGLKPKGGAEATLTLKQEYSKKPDPLRFVPNDPTGPFPGLPQQGREWLMQKCVAPWKAAEAKHIGVMVGEWGAFNKTPHDVFLRWAEDSLKNWQEAGFGWALWNFRGGFGVLDSGRSDVKYEDFEGHKLDRTLLDLLQKY